MEWVNEKERDKTRVGERVRKSGGKIWNVISSQENIHVGHQSVAVSEIHLSQKTACLNRNGDKREGIIRDEVPKRLNSIKKFKSASLIFTSGNILDESQKFIRNSTVERLVDAKFRRARGWKKFG